MKRFRVGVIGVGFIGAVHIEQLRRLGNVDVVAVAVHSRPQDKADKLCVPKGYSDYREMIDKENLDCVHICTPNNTHYEMAMYALEHGVNVVCEKPMTTTVEEAAKLRAFAEEKGLINAMNFNCRFYPMAYRMRQMVRSGEAGGIYTVHGGYLQDWLYYDTDYSWRLEPEASGESRAFADIGSHWIDLVEFITGLRVTEVLADFEIFHKTRKKPLKAIETYSGMALRPEDYAEVPISTEDYINNVIGSVEQIERLMADVNSPNLALICDPTNYFTGANIGNMDAELEKIFSRVGKYMKIAHAKDCMLAQDTSEKHADIDADESHTFRGSGDVELPAAGLGALNYELYVKLLAEQHPNMPIIVEHVDEGDIPRAKAFVDGVLRKVGV